MPSLVEALVALVTLTSLELVLGIDNLVVLALTLTRLPPNQRDSARKIGLAGALLARLGLLGTLSLVMRLTEPLFHLGHHPIAGRDLVLLGGGAFLAYKGASELYAKWRGGDDEVAHVGGRAAFAKVIAQLILLDIVFSLDSVITAVGMARDIRIMATAVVLAAFLMIAFSKVISAFLDRHAGMKVLALGFLVLVGVTLMGEGVGVHIPKTVVYGAMAFGFVMELIHIALGSTRGDAEKPAESPPSDSPKTSETNNNAGTQA
ncbi:MAG: TerC family protein [Myxococcales bacterium]|nr:TerC family protein [Myxococcales bacterium]